MKKIKKKLLSVLACLGISAVFFFLGLNAGEQAEEEQTND